MTDQLSNQERDYVRELDMGDQGEQRLEKLRELRQAGLDPYPPRAERTHTATGAIAAYEEWEAQESGSGSRESESAGATTGQNTNSGLPSPDPDAQGPQVTIVGRLRLRRPGGKIT